MKAKSVSMHFSRLMILLVLGGMEGNDFLDLIVFVNFLFQHLKIMV